MVQSLCFAPLLGVIGPCPPWSQVADKLSPQYVPQVNGEGVCAQDGEAKFLLLLGYTVYISTTQ
jgi:hypothetical protein